MSKRTKTVFGSHANLAHVWAQQTYDHGRAGDGRMLFDGRTIYSYGRHYAIACFTERGHVLFNSDGYSVTTGKHRTHVRRALIGLVPDEQVFSVPRVEDSATAHAYNLADLVKRLHEANDAALNMNKGTRGTYGKRDCEDRQGMVSAAANKALRYAEAFDLPAPFKHDDIAAMHDAIAVKWADYTDPAKVAKREKAARQRRAAQVRKLGPIMVRLQAFKEDCLPALDNAEVAQLPAYEQRQYKSLATSRRYAWDWFLNRAYHQPRELTLEQWRNGEGSAAQYGYGPNAWSHGPTRVRRMGDRLQTSRGAEVPWQAALVVFLKAQRCYATGTTWQRNGETIAIGPFQLDRIEANGDIKAGCHTIQWSEMVALAVRECPELVRPAYPLPALVAA
jgi:hypothetical protein